MTTPTIRDHCATLAGDVDYLLECNGSSDPITLQDIADRASAARAALAADPAGEGPSPAEIDELTQQHTSDLGDLRIGVAPEDVPALVYAILARWGCPAAPPAPEVGEVASERIVSIAKAVQECAFAHEPDARLIGNVCAEDVADLCAAALATPPTISQTRI
jgi:hypothetical protein